jgi:hypothetical protein
MIERMFVASGKAPTGEWFPPVSETEWDTAETVDPPVEGVWPLETVPAGPVLGMLIDGDTDTVSDADVVAVLKAHARMAAHHQARLSRTVIEISSRYGRLDGVDAEYVARATVAELRAALCLTRRAAEAELDLAIALCVRLPRVLEALEDATVDVRRARVLIDHTSHLPQASARTVADQALVRAGTLTTGQLSAYLRKLCIQHDPDQARARYEHAHSERRVVAEQAADGTVTITGIGLPADRAAAIMHRLTHTARKLKTRDEERTLDQLRADVFVDLLSGAASNGKGGSIDITVDLTTLLGLNDHPATLGGFGPVVADIARKVAKTHTKARYTYTVTDNGSVIDTGTIGRKASAATRRAVTRRHVSCIFPGCRTPATSCDLDHRQPHTDGGPASADNLAPLCRHDHTLRHTTGWTHTPNSDGTHTWTTPLHTTYTTRPPP